MPVRKFRTLDEAARSLWLEPGDPRIWDGVVRRWRLHTFFAPVARQRQRGVFRYRSIEDKQSAARGESTLTPELPDRSRSGRHDG